MTLIVTSINKLNNVLSLSDSSQLFIFSCDRNVPISDATKGSLIERNPAEHIAVTIAVRLTSRNLTIHNGKKNTIERWKNIDTKTNPKNNAMLFLSL